MYDALVGLTPALGAKIAKASAHAMAHGGAAGLEMLDALPLAQLEGHLPYWATRAAILSDLNRKPEARHAYTRAIGLCEDPAIREFLSGKLPAMEG